MSRRGKILAFLGIEYGLVFLCSLPLFLLDAEPLGPLMMGISVVFMFLPALAALIVRRLSGDRSGMFLRPNIRGTRKQYLMAAFLPGALTMAGAALYFLLFPGDLDLTMGYMSELLALSGQAVEVPAATLPQLIGAGLLLTFIAPLVVVNHIAAFGEELGWRGYLLPLLIEGLGERRAVLLDGVLWGIAHAPLVCFGLNYTGEYPGTPFTGILMMTVFATVSGIFMSYLTLRSGSIWPACIAHGAVNAVREAPLLICAAGYDALLGPKPSGLIGMAGFIIMGVLLMFRLEKRPGKSEGKNRWSAYCITEQQGED